MWPIFAVLHWFWTHYHLSGSSAAMRMLAQVSNDQSADDKNLQEANPVVCQCLTLPLPPKALKGKVKSKKLGSVLSPGNSIS